MKYFVCLLLGCCWLVSHQSAEAQEVGLTEFFQTVQQGEAESVIKLMHPQLAQQIDPPILETWLQAVAYRLGRVELIAPDVEIYNPERTVLTAEVTFTKGTAKAELVLVKGEIVAFAVKSERLANWFQRPASLQLYQERSQLFLESLLTGKFDEARKTLHPRISDQLTDEVLQQARLAISTEEEGQQVVYQQARLTILPDERLQQIDMIYELQGGIKSSKVVTVVRFHGMQGHLVGFRIED